jgi:hypothetical protein
MKYLNIVLTFAIFLALPLSASADNCSWTHASVPSGGAAASVAYTCAIDGTVAATKSVSTRAVGSSYCSLSLRSGYYNSGTCDSPDISTVNLCVNSGSVYGIFWASQWSNHVNAIESFCGTCGYSTTPIWQPQGGEPKLEVTCR